MQSMTINVRVNADDKKGFEQFCNSVGMNVSTAVNMFIKSVLREQKLPFEIKTSSFDENIYKKLKEADEELESSNKRYTKDEVIKSMNDIIGQ